MNCLGSVIIHKGAYRTVKELPERVTEQNRSGYFLAHKMFGRIWSKGKG